MEKYSICNFHQERIELISRDIDSNKLIGLCLKCLPLPQGVPYLQIKNVLNNFENNKNQMIDVIEEQKLKNKEIIRKLIDYVKEFKKSQEEKIEELINQGELEISIIEKKYNSFQEQIIEYNASIDVEDMMNLFNALQNHETLFETQQKLEQILQKIQNHSFLFDSNKILCEFPILMHFQYHENRDYLKKIYKCPKHNEIIVGVELNQKQNKQDDLICFTCIQSSQQKVFMTELSEAEKAFEEYQNNSRINYQNILMIVHRLTEQSTRKVFEKCNKIQNKLVAFLNAQSNFKNSKLKDCNVLMSKQSLCSIDYSAGNIQLLKKITKLSTRDWEKFQFQLQKLPYALEQTTINNSLRRIKQFTQQISSVQIDQVEQIKTKIQYDLITKIQQQEYCNAISINSEGKILIAGCNKRINIFQFNSGSIRKLEQLDGHSSDISCLQFMKNKNIFVSASLDKRIKIWAQQQTNNWVVTQTLQGHSGWIICLVINSNGDQIVSGGLDSSIKFWSLNNENWNNSQTISNFLKVNGLSLNESENKLICSDFNKILVMEQVQKNEWSIIQKISVNGCQVCFITDEYFSFQLCSPKRKIEIYSYNDSQKQFKQSKSIQTKDNKHCNKDDFQFPSKFIKSKQVLVSKDRNFLNIIRINDCGDFIVDQYIDFLNERCYGTISDDGKWLVTWDEGNGEIQVSKYNEMILN